MDLTSKLFSRLFPSRCVLCSHSVSGAVEICVDCCNRLPFNTSCCMHCSLPLLHVASKQTLCGRCIKKRPSYDFSRSVFRYEGEVIPMIHKLKFSEKITYARSFGELLLSEFDRSGILENERPDCLLPVPLHASRMRRRGFNQSIEIARVINKKYGMPVELHAVTRQRKTDAQTGLNAQARQKNIRGAFAVRDEMLHKRVLIIDDVVTTGSTVNELAKLLKKNNVERVGVLSIARAPIKI